MTCIDEYTPKRTEQNLIVRIGKSEAEVMIIKDCARGILLLLKLTSERHEASRGLSATAEILVGIVTKIGQFLCRRL